MSRPCSRADHLSAVPTSEAASLTVNHTPHSSEGDCTTAGFVPFAVRRCSATRRSADNIAWQADRYQPSWCAAR